MKTDEPNLESLRAFSQVMDRQGKINMLELGHIKELETRGFSKSEIADILKKKYANWSDKDIDNAFTQDVAVTLERGRQADQKRTADWITVIENLAKQGYSENGIREVVAKNAGLSSIKEVDRHLEKLDLPSIRDIVTTSRAAPRFFGKFKHFFYRNFGISFIAICFGWFIWTIAIMALDGIDIVRIYNDEEWFIVLVVLPAIVLAITVWVRRFVLRK